MGLGYLWRFYDSIVDLYFNNYLICNEYLVHGFIVLKKICNVADSSNEIFHITNSVTNESHIIGWHTRLSHIGPARMDRLAKRGLLSNVQKVENSTCEHCLVEKTSRKPFGSGTRADVPLQAIHSDICGPMNVKT